MSYDASDCVFHIVLCHTPEIISYVYGNLFTIVKIGCFTKLWINYTIWDGQSLFNEVMVVPDSIMDLISSLEVCEKIGGYHLITISDDLGYDMNSTDTLDKVGKECIGLKGWVTTQDGIVCQNTAMKAMVHRSKPFSQWSKPFSLFSRGFSSQRLYSSDKSMLIEAIDAIYSKEWMDKGFSPKAEDGLKEINQD